MKKIPLTLANTEKISNGLEILLKGLYIIGERGHTIQIVQGYLGQFLTAKVYLEKGLKVFWVYPEYDLYIEGIGKLEVKTAKCWSKDGNSDANVFGLELNKFDIFILVLINGDNEVFKVLSIPKPELKECEKIHDFIVGNKRSPCFVYYDRRGLKRAEKEGFEIYMIEKNIALHEKSYLLWCK